MLLLLYGSVGALAAFFYMLVWKANVRRVRRDDEQRTIH
jgi:hypothetical protein